MATKANNTKKKRTKKPAPAAVAIHGKHEDGKHHFVGIGNLRVVLIPDGKFWFAQGLEIDYSAQGETIEDAKRHFEQGLTATIHQNLRIFGNIQKMLRVAPDEAWMLLWKDSQAKRRIYSQVTAHEIVRQTLAFNEIDYVQPDLMAS